MAEATADCRGGRLLHYCGRSICSVGLGLWGAATLVGSDHQFPPLLSPGTNCAFQIALAAQLR
jgi:hypothetical protein